MAPPHVEPEEVRRPKWVLSRLGAAQAHHTRHSTGRGGSAGAGGVLCGCGLRGARRGGKRAPLAPLGPARRASSATPLRPAPAPRCGSERARMSGGARARGGGGGCLGDQPREERGVYGPAGGLEPEASGLRCSYGFQVPGDIQHAARTRPGRRQAQGRAAAARAGPGENRELPRGERGVAAAVGAARVPAARVPAVPSSRVRKGVRGRAVQPPHRRLQPRRAAAPSARGPGRIAARAGSGSRALSCRNGARCASCPAVTNATTGTPSFRTCTRACGQLRSARGRRAGRRGGPELGRGLACLSE